MEKQKQEKMCRSPVHNSHKFCTKKKRRIKARKEYKATRTIKSRKVLQVHPRFLRAVYRTTIKKQQYNLMANKRVEWGNNGKKKKCGKR